MILLFSFFGVFGIIDLAFSSELMTVTVDTYSMILTMVSYCMPARICNLVRRYICEGVVLE